MENIQSQLIPGLSNDVSLNCISRVPIEDRRSLPQVSKSWQRAFSSGELYERIYKIRKAHKLSEKCYILHYIQFVGSNEANYLDGDYKSFLNLRLYNPKTSHLSSFAFFELQHSDGKPLKFNGIMLQLDLTAFTVDSDTYIIPFGSSDFWVFRGKSHKLDHINIPNGENWSTDFALNLQGKLIFGRIVEKGESSGVHLRILDQNGEWITTSSKNFKFYPNVGEVGVLEGNLYFKEFENSLGAESSYITFGLEKCDWSMKYAETQSQLYSKHGQQRYACLNGVYFKVQFDFSLDELLGEIQNGGLKLERFDKSEESWVQLSQIDHSPPKFVKMIASGDSLHILSSYFKEDHYRYLVFSLNVFNLFKSEHGEISGNWDPVNFNFHSSFDLNNLVRLVSFSLIKL